MFRNGLRCFLAMTLLIASLMPIMSTACTGIQLKASDGSFVNGRTVEFASPIELSGMVFPRNYEFKGQLPDGSPGLIYKSKYAAVGAITFGNPAIVDGVNEKGLSIGMFYFPGYAGYATITPENKSKALSPVDFPNWILSQFSTIDEVKQGLKTVVIAPSTPKGWPALPPFHYVVYDKSGKSLVIEPVNGELKVYDNPVGVLTNSPTFDWHLTNLSNYINLTPLNAPSVKIDGMKLQQFGEGSGLHGLPGDFSPPSRFVRAVIFSTTAIPAANAEKSVISAFHLLNQFDLPVGAVRSMDNKKMEVDATLATTVKDPVNLKYYLRTYQDQNIRVINLNSFNLDTKELKYIGFGGSQTVTDISSHTTLN